MANTFSLVSALIEGAEVGGFYGESSITAEQAESYTLESGAFQIARECAEELQDIFSVAIVETNEAALAAHMEGCEDVMESAEYGPVFEAAEKKAGSKIVAFLVRLKDKVVAFFKSIASRVSAFVNDYDKFYKKHKDKMLEAQSKRKEQLKVEVTGWNDTNIDKLAQTINALADKIASIGKELSEEAKAAAFGKDGKELEDGQMKTYKMNKLNGKCNDAFTDILKRCGVGGSGNMTSETFDMERVNKNMRLAFAGGKVTKVIDVKYIESSLTGANKAAKDVQAAQKKFNDAYKTAINAVNKTIKELENGKKSGYGQALNKVCSTLSKCQTVINAYAQNGYRAVIGRASEGKRLTNVVISGKVPKKKD